ncbi:MAG: hypothetical protein OQK79_07635 [Rhodanobacter sp.]|nr:hypothetical protein [Rhodanobacter sp.]
MSGLLTEVNADFEYAARSATQNLMAFASSIGDVANRWSGR